MYGKKIEEVFNDDVQECVLEAIFKDKIQPHWKRIIEEREYLRENQRMIDDELTFQEELKKTMNNKRKNEDDFAPSAKKKKHSSPPIPYIDRHRYYSSQLMPCSVKSPKICTRKTNGRIGQLVVCHECSQYIRISKCKTQDCHGIAQYKNDGNLNPFCKDCSIQCYVCCKKSYGKICYTCINSSQCIECCTRVKRIGNRCNECHTYFPYSE